MTQELVTERGQAEHVVFLLGPLDWGPGFNRDITTPEVFTRQSDLRDLGVGIEALVRNGVPPGVLPFIYEALFLEEVLSNR